MLKHRCHAHGCDKGIPPKLLFCRRHWGMLCAALQREIWRTYVPGQEDRKDPSAEYLVAHHRSVAFVARREGHVAASVEHEALAITHQRRIVVETIED